MSEKYTKIDNLRIRYRDSGGNKPLLLLLHGWGANADLFRYIEEYVSSVYRAVSPDIAGFGKSEEPDHPYDLDDYVDFIRDFVHKLYEDEKEELPKDIIILGHSHGGRCLIRLLSRAARGEDFGFGVKKAVLVDSAGIKAVQSKEQLKRTDRYKRYKSFFIKSGLSRLFPSLIDKLQKKYGSADYAAASPVMRQSMVKVVNCDLKEEMPFIKIPVLLIWGDMDTATPLSDGKIMEELMPEAGLAVIQGAGHYSFLDNVNLFNRILGSFLGI